MSPKIPNTVAVLEIVFKSTYRLHPCKRDASGKVVLASAADLKRFLRVLPK